MSEPCWARRSSEQGSQGKTSRMSRRPISRLSRYTHAKQKQSSAGIVIQGYGLTCCLGSEERRHALRRHEVCGTRRLPCLAFRDKQHRHEPQEPPQSSCKERTGVQRRHGSTAFNSARPFESGTWGLPTRNGKWFRWTLNFADTGRRRIFGLKWLGVAASKGKAAEGREGYASFRVQWH